MAVVVPYEDMQRRREQDRLCFEQRLKGTPVRDIAEALGIDVREVQASLRRMVTSISPTYRADLVELELERLDAMMSRHFDSATLGSIDSADLVLKIMDRRAKLLGLDAPAKTDHTLRSERKEELTGTPTDMMLTRLRKLRGETEDGSPIIEGEIVSE